MAFVRRELAGARDLLPLAAAWPARYPCLLESAARGSARARYDVLFATRGEAIVLHADGRVRNGRGHEIAEAFLPALDAAFARERDAADDSRTTTAVPDDLPFHGGWVVFLAYEMAHEIEPVLGPRPLQSGATPLALALRCPAAIVVDHVAQRTVLVAETGHAEWLDAMAGDLEHGPAQPAALALPRRVVEDPAEAFLDGVARIHAHLEAGDVFQVNLSRGWSARFDTAPAPAALYAALRRANPAPFAALLQWRGWAVASSSPERLIEVRGHDVQTRPIAGTRPRFAGDDDAARIRELVGHVKERAEHVMLIDLERNDLGRICEPGSVRVDELMSVESYAHVHHIVSNVRGRLREGTSPGAAIRAVFPGGTITGAPKVRTMQIIRAIEGVPRGAYTGSLGYLDRSGDMDLNILIRTLEIEGTRATFRAGAGIVADSDAARELDETRAKARGMLRALGADD